MDHKKELQWSPHEQKHQLREAVRLAAGQKRGELEAKCKTAPTAPTRQAKAKQKAESAAPEGLPHGRSSHLCSGKS